MTSLDRPKPDPLAAIVGRDPGLQTVLARAARVAPTRTPVLVTGESGTGKELLARALHDLGPAPGGPLVTVNCGALSRELAESELFGHERGAFTGAAARRAGWFEEASGGTLVLDEIGELPPELQPKLLRVLETGYIRRVGGVGETPVRVRVVAMTLRDLRREIERGGFRLDLYHRLAGFELTLPPLRRRPHDVPLLARHFLVDLTRELGPRTLTPAALDRLIAYDWPGNVRELRNVLRRAAILADELIDESALELAPPPCELRLAHYAADAATVLPLPAPRPVPSESGDLLALAGRSFAELEQAIFVWALRQHGGSRRRAARALGISRSTFCDRVRRLGLAPPGGAPTPVDGAAPLIANAA
jgi:two-component system nitrogen regulation response regulator GlnG